MVDKVSINTCLSAFVYLSIRVCLPLCVCVLFIMVWRITCWTCDSRPSPSPKFHCVCLYVSVSVTVCMVLTLRRRRFSCLWSASVCESSLSEEASRFSGSLMLGGIITRTAADLFGMPPPTAVEVSAAAL